MPDISTIVSISITRATATPSRPPLAVMNIVGNSQVFPERIRTYSSLSGMSGDGFAASSPEYLAASAMKAQNPSVKKWKVSRLSNTPVDTCSLAVKSQSTALGEIFDFKIDDTEIVYTTTAADTTTAAVSLKLYALMTSVPGLTVTASGGVLSAFKASGALRLRGWQRRLLAYKNLRSSSSTTITSDLDAILLADKGFYGVTPTGRSAAEIEAVAAWCETNKRLQAYDSSDDQNVDPAVLNDVFSTLKGLNDDRSFGYQNANDTYGFTGAAIMSLMFAKFKPGQATWEFKALKNVATDDLNVNEINALEGKNANYYVAISELPVLQGGGKVASGEYVDIIHGIDWLESELQVQVFRTLANAPKVPFTDTGLDIIRNDVLGVLRRGAAAGLLVEDSIFVEMPLVADIDPVTKGERKLEGVLFNAELQGAVHKVGIEGTVTI